MSTWGVRMYTRKELTTLIKYIWSKMESLSSPRSCWSLFLRPRIAFCIAQRQEQKRLRLNLQLLNSAIAGLNSKDRFIIIQSKREKQKKNPFRFVFWATRTSSVTRSCSKRIMICVHVQWDAWEITALWSALIKTPWFQQLRKILRCWTWWNINGHIFS